MKKILILLLLIFSMKLTIAQEVILNPVPMPMDSEVEKLLQNFNMSEEQKQEIYIKAQQQAQEILQTQDSEVIKKQLQQALQTINEAGISLDGMLPEVQKTDRNIEAIEPKMPDRPKKYAKHPPLTRRSEIRSEYKY